MIAIVRTNVVWDLYGKYRDECAGMQVWLLTRSQRRESGCCMLGDDRSGQRVWMGPEWRDDPRQGDWRAYFGDVVDLVCPDAESRGPRYGYSAEPHAGREVRGGGRHADRHGKRRRGGSGNRNGVAALTAAAVVGTGVGAGVLGVVPFMAPAATSPGVTTSTHAPPAPSRSASGASVQHQTGYVGKHRKAAAVQSSAPAHLGTQAAASPAGSAPSSDVTYAQASAGRSSAAGSYQGGTSSSAPAVSQPAAPHSASPEPQGGSGTAAGRGGGTPASTGTSAGGGSASTSSGGTSSTSGGSSGGGTSSTSGGTASGGQGVVGGLVGGVTGLVGGLL